MPVKMMIHAHKCFKLFHYWCSLKQLLKLKMVINAVNRGLNHSKAVYSMFYNLYELLKQAVFLQFLY